MSVETLSIFSTITTWGWGIVATFFYFTRRYREAFHTTKLMRRVAWGAAITFAGLVLFSTMLQYTIWSNDPLSSKLLPPHQSILYFLKYAGVHFWLAPFIAFALALAFYFFLHALERKNERFFGEGEVELGALAAFLVGWPRFIIFLPVVFLVVVLISGAKLIFKKGAYTTLGLPFLIGLGVTLAYGYAVIDLLGLSGLGVIPGVR